MQKTVLLTFRRGIRGNVFTVIFACWIGKERSPQVTCIACKTLGVAFLQVPFTNTECTSFTVRNWRKSLTKTQV